MENKQDKINQQLRNFTIENTDLVLDRCLKHRLFACRFKEGQKPSNFATICGHENSNGLQYSSYCHDCAVKLAKCYHCGERALHLSEWDAKFATQIITEEPTLILAIKKDVDKIYTPCLSRMKLEPKLNFQSYRELLEWLIILGETTLPIGICVSHWINQTMGNIMTMDIGHCAHCHNGMSSGSQTYHKECAKKLGKCYLCDLPEANLLSFDVQLAKKITKSQSCSTQMDVEPIDQEQILAWPELGKKMNHQFKLVQNGLDTGKIYLWGQFYIFLNAINKWPFDLPPNKNEYMLEFYL